MDEIDHSSGLASIPSGALFVYLDGDSTRMTYLVHMLNPVRAGRSPVTYLEFVF